MKNHKLFNKINLLILLIVILSILIAGCNRNQKKPNPNKDNMESEVPEVLVEMEDDILKIMYDVDSTSGLKKAVEEEKQSQEKEKQSQQQMEEKSDNKSDNKKEKEEKKNKESEEPVNVQMLIEKNQIIIPLLTVDDIEGNFTDSNKPPKDIGEVWFKISSKSKEIHRKWNVLESQLEAANVPRDEIDAFENTLNKLTLSLNENEKIESLMLSNELTNHLAGFRSYFKSKSPHSIYRMKYHIRQSILLAASDEYKEALQQVEKTKKIGNSLRKQVMKKNGENVIKKFEMSIDDLKQQLDKKEFSLAQIKAPIVIKNILLIDDIFQSNIKK